MFPRPAKPYSPHKNWNRDNIELSQQSSQYRKMQLNAGGRDDYLPLLDFKIGMVFYSSAVATNVLRLSSQNKPFKLRMNPQQQ